MKAIVVYGFSKISDGDLSTTSRHIINCMTGNTNFPDAGPLVAKVKTASDAFDKELLETIDGGTSNTARKDLCRVSVEDELKVLGLHVQTNCKNDLSILLSSGFKNKKPGEPVEELDAPDNLKVTNGKSSGTIDVSVDKVKGAHTYVFQYTEVPVTEKSAWVTLVGKAKRSIKNLTPGTQIAVKAAVQGTSEELNFTDIVTRYVA